MNRIARTAAHLVAATGLAAAALTLSSTAAHADSPNGPGQIELAPHTDPEGPVVAIPTPAPKPLPVPPKPKSPQTPKGPGVIVNAPHCTHGCGGSEAPKDLSDAPASEPTQDPADEPNQDPTDDSNQAPTAGPTDDPASSPQDQGCFTGCDLPETDPAVAPEVDVANPSSVDVGAVPAESSAPEDAVNGTSSFGLAFYLGLGLFSLAAAVAVALLARRLVERRARA